METPAKHTARAADGTEIHFEIYGDRSRPAILLGPHFYCTRSEDDDSYTDLWIGSLQRDFFLINADYPRGTGQTGNPQGFDFTPTIAAQEYECIADAAGVKRFGWLGYSFGGAMGVQVACRTGRVSALAVGGFPPLNAPFQLMADNHRKLIEQPRPLPASINPGVIRSALGFYTTLTRWPERQEISKLTMPRLVFMGDQDGAADSADIGHLADDLRAVEGDLRTLGWQIAWLKGQDHMTTLRPEVSVALVQRFFRNALLG